MSSSQYWTSLWGLGIIIFLFLLISVLAMLIFGFLYDRISVLEIWNSPVWLKIKVPLIVLCVMCFLTALLTYFYYGNRKYLQATREYAQEQGWRFSQNDTQGLKSMAADILWDLDFNLYNIRTVETGKLNLYLFDLEYNHQKEIDTDYAYGTACLIESNRFSSGDVSVCITSRDWTEVMQPHKVDMGKSLFVQKFLVISKYPVAAKEVVNSSIQEIMLVQLEKPSYNPVSVYIGPGGAVVLTGRTNEHERLHDLIDLARRIEEGVFFKGLYG